MQIAEGFDYEGLKLIYENIEHGLVVKDADDKVLFCNTHAYKILGLTKEQLLGTSLYSNDWKLLNTNSDPLDNNEIPSIKAIKTKRKVKNIIGIKSPEHFEGVRWLSITANPRLLDNGEIDLVYVSLLDITHQKEIENKLTKEYKLIEIIQKTQERYILNYDNYLVFNKLLDELIELTNSGFGFIGEVFYDENNQKYFKTYAISNIAWDAQTEKFFRENYKQGLEFRNLNTLFGQVLVSEEPLISLDPANDKYSAGIPKGHPKLENFIGIPIKIENNLLGMIALANNPIGFNSDDIKFLEPLITNIGYLIISKREREEKLRIENELKRASFAIDNSGDFVLWINEKAEIVYANDSACNALGYTKDEVLYLKVKDLDINYTEDAWLEHWKNLKEKKTIKLESKLKSKNNCLIDVDITANYLEIGDLKLNCGFVRDIRVRKKIENDLKESEERWKFALEGLGTFVWVWDIKNNKFKISESFFKYLNYEPQQNINFIKDIKHKEDHGKIFNSIILEKDNYGEEEVRFLNSSGEYQWFSSRGGIFEKDENGEAQILIGALYDISEKKIAVNAVKDSEEKLKESQRIAKIGNWDLNLSNNIYTISDSFYEIIGKEIGAEISTDEAYSMVYKDDVEYVKSHFENMLNNIESQAKYRLRTDNSIKWIKSIAKTTFDENNKPISIKGVIQDITDSIIAEQEKEKIRQNLKSILSAIPDFLFDVDYDGTIYEFHTISDSLLYTQPSNFIGKKFSEILPKETTQVISMALKDAKLNGTHRGAVYSLEINSEVKWYELAISKKDTNETEDRFIVLARDVTKRIISEKQVNELLAELKISNSELEKSLAERDRFFSIIAHDLRSPLSGFLSLTKMLAEEFDAYTLQELENFINNLHFSAESIFKLLENLLEWARLKQKLIVFNPVKLDLNKLIIEITMLFQTQADSKDIKLTYLPITDIDFEGDKYMLSATLRNIISNSIKFTNQNGEVKIYGQIVNGNLLELSIKDNGIGMDTNILNNLFVLSKGRTRPGTKGEQSSGLGLLLCKEFVEAHGGEIEADSQIGVGTTFKIYLPISHYLV
jgi:PAS domain S-box-containing protein